MRIKLFWVFLTFDTENPRHWCVKLIYLYRLISLKS
jgi:hypothetical protein